MPEASWEDKVYISIVQNKDTIIITFKEFIDSSNLMH